MASSNNNPLSFALLSVEGDNQDTGDKDLERAFQSLSLKQRLAAIQTAVGSDDAKLAFLPGAGAVYMSGCKYAVVENRWMAIFTGEIENYSYLVKKYCLAEAGLDPQGQYLLETVRALSPLNDAQVVALLFKKLGPTFMSKLRGTFTFAVYDSNVGRVLAANDCNGSGSLWQGHVDDCLVVACNMEVPTIQVAERTAIAAGEYKFGWRAAPVAYMASQQAVQSRCNEAMQAAMAALASASGPLPSSASGPIPTPSTPVPVLNRRYSKTMHRHSFQGSSRISLSAGASSVSSTAHTCASWNTPDSGAPRNSTSSQPGEGGGGSYVPPHRRSQQYGPSYAPYAPASSKRGLSRNSTSSASGTTWRRSTSDATCRPPPNPGYNNRTPPVSTSTTATSALRRPSASGTRPAVREEDPVSTKPGTSVPNTNSTSLRDAILLAGDDDEDYVATTMDSWRLAASSMLFQPAKVGASPTQPAPSGTAAAAAAAVPLQSQPAEPDRAVQDTGIANESLACQSSPIPIHHSSDARPNVDQNHAIGHLAMGSALAGVGPVVLEGRQLQTTLESGVGRSSSYAGAQPEPESSFRTGFGQQEVRPVLPQIEAGADVHLGTSVYDPSGVHNPSHSPIFMPAASSAECVEAKRLLDLATKLANGVKTTAPTTETKQPLQSDNGCTVDQADTFGDASAPQLLHSVEHNSSDAAVAAQPLQGQQAPAMTTSGSFSDALALLLQARSCKTGTPASPTAALRSGLSISTLGLSTTTACAPSNEASQETVCEVPVQPKGLQEAGASDATLLKQPELDDRQRSVNAGVAWQFGDRLIPPQLLQECELP